MKSKFLGEPIAGFMLLPKTPEAAYRGVDRKPFHPILLDSEIIEGGLINGPLAIWQFYPPGWRREAYKLYEDNLVENGYLNEGLDLVKDYQVAKRIMDILRDHVGFHEIIRVSVVSVPDVSALNATVTPGILGYDLAYPGGDYYSALRNGLLVDVNSSLKVDWRVPFRSHLNDNGLFSTTDPIANYLECFKKNAPSEANSTFVVFRLEISPALPAPPVLPENSIGPVSEKQT
jgi:hypothetical protein